MAGGYSGKLLRVDLTAGTVRDEPLPGDDVLRKYVGCVGLGVKTLCEELPPGAKPLDPSNPLIFMTGPLTGTPVPGASNCCVITYNAETGFTAGTAHTHGQFGPQLKYAGYDGIVVTGASPRPVFLWVHDGKAEIRDAGKVWGKDTHETEDLVKAEVGEPRASVAAIGPAGENLLGGASIENDKHHLAAAGGVGAVMGSKKLKAVAAFGHGAIPVARPKDLIEVTAAWRPASAAARQNTPALITKRWAFFGDIGVLATKNLLAPAQGKDIGHKYADACLTYIKPVGKPCLSCPVACSYKAKVTSGPRQGLVGTLGGGGESMEGAAAMVGVSDPADVVWITDLYDRLGMNASSVGCAISLAFECYERGLLTREDTDGLELRWGNVEVAAALVKKVVAREGFGKVLAEGPKKAAELIGGEAPKYAVHMKGAGFNLHDWRGRYAKMLDQTVSGAGPRHESMAPDGFSPTPTKIEGAAETIAKTQRSKLFKDCVGSCMFMWTGGASVATEMRALAAVTGWEGLTEDEMLAVGSRVANMERVFNMAHGLTIADDLDMSPRMQEAPAEGPAKGHSMAPYLKGAVMDYYRFMGWEPETGRPLPQTLARLGLEHMATQLP
ncbi:MAG: hypothetical protein HYY01_08360 [Chloroflexi bacterium]|nr:hypothetical protein [Chloroflexota bacterium]